MIGPFVEVGGDVVRRRADHLHAARMGLVIGLGALEAGQERVVDVDAAARKERRQVVRQDLHVARQHHQLGARLLDQRLTCASCCALVSLRDRQVVEGNVAGSLDVTIQRLARVVGDDADDIHRQLADAQR
jgi:hypothetical protein